MSANSLKDVFCGVSEDIVSFPRRYLKHVYETEKADVCNENYDNPDFDPDTHNFTDVKLYTGARGLSLGCISTFVGVVAYTACGNPGLSTALGLASGLLVYPALRTKFEQSVMDVLTEDNKDGLENLPQPLKIFPSLDKSDKPCGP